MKKFLSLLLAVLLIAQTLTMVVSANMFNDDELYWGCDHVYNDACDTTCNLCKEKREAPHAIPEGAPACALICAICADNFSTAEHVLENETCDSHCKNCGRLVNKKPPHAYANSCDQTCMICGELTNPEAAHTVTHVAAVEATCTQLGNLEFWMCEICGGMWLDEALTLSTNRQNVKVFADHVYQYTCDKICMVCGEETNPDAHHKIVNIPATDATCQTPGNIAYWQCDDCAGMWQDEECTKPLDPESVKVYAEHTYNKTCDTHCNQCGELTNPDATHPVTYVPAVEATCTANGNVAYWICAECDGVWLDEALTQQSNKLMVVVAATGHVYDDDRDADCNACGEIRDVNRIAGDANGDGKVNNRDLIIVLRYVTGWDNVVINEAYADVDGVAGVTMADAVLLQQYLNGKSVTLM